MSMQPEPVPPIVTCDNGDVMLYPSIGEAELGVDAVDVRDGVYEVFDSVGHRLSIDAEGEKVWIGLNRELGSDEDELANRLRQFVRRVGAERIDMSSPENADLGELIGTLRRFFRV